MNLSKRDIRLLIILAGLVLVLVVYFLPVSNMNDETGQVQSEISSMSPRLDELRQHREKHGEYQSGILSAVATFEEESAAYPEQVRTEDLIMFAVMLEEDFDFIIDSVSFSEPWIVSGFTGITVVDEQIGQGEYVASAVNMTVSCNTSYANLKLAIKHINSSDEKTIVDSVSVSYSHDTGSLSGTMTITKFFLTDGQYEYVPTDVDMGRLGVPNPFGSIVEAIPEPEEG